MGYLNTAVGGASATRSNATLTINNSTDQSFSGVIDDNLSTLTLVKTGSGVLTLSGTNDYSGSTSITAGTVYITNAAGLGSASSGTTISDGAMLKISGGVDRC